MNRRLFYRLSALAVVLLFAAWWFTSAVALATRWFDLGFLLLPVLVGVIGIGMFFYGWREIVSGPIIAGMVLLGISGILIWQLGTYQGLQWGSGWLLLPGLAGAGILIENLLGPGWRFSNRLALGLLAASAILVLASGLLPLHQFKDLIQPQLAKLGDIENNWRLSRLDLKGLIPFKTFLFLDWR